MAKVHTKRETGALPVQSVAWNYPMAALSFLIALNIVSMPLRAYLTETLPWKGRTQPLEWNGTTYAANSTWMVLQRMQALYTDETLPPNATFFKDTANYTTVMRRSLEFEPGVPCANYFHHLPGAIFFGQGMRDAICTYLQTNASSMAKCQHMRHFGHTIAEQCIWIYSQTSTSSRVVYQTLYQWEIVWFLWVKFAFRCVLTGYVLRTMQAHYYSHCLALARDLKVYGIPEPVAPIHRIEVYIGDTTCLILGDPVVSLCFVVDIWMSVSSVGGVVLQLSQLDYLSVTVTGWIYVSRTVWFAYFLMGCTTIALKWRHASRWVWFVPLDPMTIAVGALVLSGPYVYLNATTPLVWLQYTLWSVGVPENDLNECTEVFPSIVALTTIMGLVPVCILVAMNALRLAGRAAVKPPATQQRKRSDIPSRHYSSKEFNDLNQRLLLGMVLPSAPSMRSRGGSAYLLYDLCAKFQNMPLFSHRSADCYVVGYDGDNHPVEHMRLSLLRCVDLSSNGRATTLENCGQTHLAPMCQVNTTPCAATSNLTTIRLHPGVDKSQWLL